MKNIFLLVIGMLIAVSAGIGDTLQYKQDNAAEIFIKFVESDITYKNETDIPAKEPVKKQLYNYYSYSNNYWREYPNVTGYSMDGQSFEETLEGYSSGMEHMVGYEIKYENGMKQYVEREYKKNYPNEMGLCLEARIENESMIVYNYSSALIDYQNPTSIRFGCIERTDNTIGVHSHPDIQTVWNMCYPSGIDVLSEWEYEMIVCGVGEDITEVIAYKAETVYYGGITITVG